MGGITMKKLLTVVAALAGIITMITAVVALCLYMEDIVKVFTKFKDKYWKKKAVAEEIFED